MILIFQIRLVKADEKQIVKIARFYLELWNYRYF